MKKILLILAVVLMGVTAAEAQKVRVMSYNVKNGGGLDGIKDITRIHTLIHIHCGNTRGFITANYAPLYR